MKSFEPTEHKIRKEKKRGNLLKMEFTASIIGMVCQLGLILFLAKNYILDSINSLVDNSFDLPSRIKLLIGNLFSSILISTSTFAAFQVLIFVILNKGLWTRSESRFQPGGNFKTFFSSFRKALIQLVFMVLFTLVVVFVCRQGILTQKEVIVVSIVGLGLFLCLCFLEISIEPVLYKKKLKY
ncbi:MAG: EscU/YscU/HrcU family type III secretion system export apparatus switch protein [Deltaproteobacteria bacterium]|nr:EscU/YscU/HrcU family type III secretion system export apparatus switch protein [Deltaproteobacteria bacterium]